MIKKKSSNSKISRRRPVQQKKNSRLLEMAIAAIFALVVIYGASFAIRITSGLSKTVETPDYTIRLQVLNGCGISGAAGKIAKALPDLVGLPIEIEVVEIDDFNAYHVTNSFLISRDRDTDPVKILADQLDLNRDDILYDPIENNYRSIYATLVLGDDFEKILESR
jgi:hypothetical protein